MNNTTILMILGVTGGFLFLRLGLLNRIRGIKTVNVLEANELISSQGAVVLDVREPEEYAAARIPGASHIPLRQIPHRLAELEPLRAKPIVISCRSGSRSARACSMLKKHGFTQVYNLQGGLGAWVRADLELER